MVLRHHQDALISFYPHAPMTHTATPAEPLLLPHFDLLATAPGGVARLRELILTLAVQGKLVPQDPSDEPASVLLQRIRAEKDRLIAAGKIKRDKPLPPIADEEKPFELPVGWAFCRLGNLLLSIRSGGTPSKQNPSYWDGDIPWASVKDLSFGSPIINTQDRITQAGLDAGSELAPAGSILICTRMGLGKIGEALIDVAINQDLKAVTLGNGVDKRYFINYFKTLSVVGSGMTVAGIKQEELLGFIVPLPPLAEQSRIVARVEELMRLCDALEAQQTLHTAQHTQLVQTLLGTLTDSATPAELADQWQRVAAHFDTLFDRPEAVDALEQTILQLAVRGLLVPQDPNDEPASVLLQRIRAEKDRLIAAGKIKRDKPLPPIADEEKPFELPGGWEWVRCADYFLELCTGPFGSVIHKEDYVSDGVPLINPSHMIDGKIIHDPRVTLKPEDAIKLSAYTLSAGDLVLARRGEVGRYALVTEREAGWLCGTGSFFIRLHSSCNRTYLGLTFLDSRFRQNLQVESVGTTMTNLNQRILLEALIALPPLAEQSRIVARVEELHQLCNNLRQRLAAGRTTQCHLAEALLESAGAA